MQAARGWGPVGGSHRVLATVLAVLLAATGARALAATGPGCDRGCLTGMMNGFVAALLAHDASRLPVAPDLKYTENLVPLRFGHEGLWATVDGRRDFNIYALDPGRGDVSWVGILRENGKAVMTAVRLKVAGLSITEAEIVVGRSALTAADTVPGPRPDFAHEIPPAERAPRESLIKIADSNWDAMEQGNGDLAPYAADCERYDNGHKTTNGPSPGPHGMHNGARNDAHSDGHTDTVGAGATEPATAVQGDIGALGCYGQMNSGRFKNGNKVYPRRIWTVDQEHGLVVGLFTPNVPGTARTLALRDGTTVTVGPDELIPFTIVQVELFRIVHGEISRVEVVLGPRVPFGMRSPFDMATLWQPR